MEEIKIGIDLGGSKFRIGIVNSNNEIIGETIRVSIDDIIKSEDLVTGITDSVESILKINGLTKKDIVRIGIGSPGPLDSETGTILETLNLTYLRGFPLGEKLKESLSLDIVIGNDANCFVLGQQIAGAAVGFHNVIGITLGTGYGCGIIIDGVLVDGSTGTAGEYANSPYLDGVFEDYVSGRGLKKIYKKFSGELKRPFQIEDEARSGSKDAIESFQEFGTHIGISLSYTVNLLDPEIIVIGGSIANAYDLFIDSVWKSLRLNIYNIPAERLTIKPAVDGEQNAVIGAAMLYDSRSKTHSKSNKQYTIIQ